MRTFAGGQIKFYLKSTVDLRFELEGPQNQKAGVVVPSTAGQWQEVAYPISTFTEGVDLSHMYGLFLITSTDGPATFYVDDVRWIKPPPALSLTRSGSRVVITWPTNVAGFVLQWSTNLALTNWTTATPAPVVVRGQYTVTNYSTNDFRLYRLRK